MAFVPVHDFRVQALVECCDYLTIENVHRAFPHLVSREELAAFRAVLNAEDLGGPPFDPTDDWLDTEWLMTERADSRSAMMRRLVTEVLRPRRTLDVGAFVGAHGIALSNLLGPESHVTLREANAELRGAMERLIAKKAQYPAALDISIGRDVPSQAQGTYDCVWAGEVLEHQLDPLHFLSQLESTCRVGGLVMVSTPVGPWERATKTHMHVTQWEPEDYIDIAGHRPNFCVMFLSHNFQIYASATQDEFARYVETKPWQHGDRGVVVARWSVTDAPLRSIQWPRKLAAWGFEMTPSMRNVPMQDALTREG